jgi:hypothetical protein
LLTHHLRKMDKSKAGARKEVHLGDLFGSSYIVNGASDVWAVVRDSESKEPKFVLTVLKPRPGITMAGDRFELIGSNEDLSLTITSHNGEADGTEKLRGLKAKVVDCLKGRTEDTALDLTEISAAVNSHRGSVERVVKSLVSAEHPGLQRAGQKRVGLCKPTYVYWVE